MRCERCHEKGADKRCGRCREAWYCGAACQKQHWKDGHKHKCATKAERKPQARAAVVLRAVAAAAAQSGGGGASAGGEECAICLDMLQQPQTLPCGHRFCRGCVASMRERGVGATHVCPLCRGPMPDAERLCLEASRMLTQHKRLQKGEQEGAPQPPRAQELLSRAAGLCREALAVDPEHAWAHLNLGYVLERLGDLDGAISAFRAATAADPQYASAHFNLGILLEKRGGVAGVEAAFRAAIAADPQLAQAHMSMGCILANRGDHAGAAALFAKVVQIEPFYPNAQQYLTQMQEEELV